MVDVFAKVARDIIRKMGLVQSPAQAQRAKSDGNSPTKQQAGEEEGEAAGKIEQDAAAMEQAQMARFITHVEDRFFNDLRYTVNCSSLKALGWKEEVRLCLVSI